MVTFAERFRQESQGGSLQRPNNSFAERFRQEQGSVLVERMKQQREQERQQREQQAFEAFNQRQQEVAQQSGVKSFFSAIKEQFGKGETLPQLENESNYYKSIRESQEMDKSAKGMLVGRAGNAIAEGSGAVVGMAKQRQKEIEQLNQEQGRLKTNIDLNIGAAKNTGQLAMGAVKAVAGFTPLTGHSNVRKIIKSVGGKKVEEYMDRTTPAYLKAVDAFMDDNGIINYKPQYANIAQKTGGEVAEIGSWFIPITRLGKVAKIERSIGNAMKKIPVVAKALGTSPKVVNSGGKLFYEVSKDVVDVAILDSLRGKSWEEIEEQMPFVVGGGAGLRVAGAGLGKIFQATKANKIMSNVESALGKLDDEETQIASRLMDEGKTADDITTAVMVEREQAGKSLDDIIESATKEDVTEDVVEKTAKAEPQPEVTTEVKKDVVEKVDEPLSERESALEYSRAKRAKTGDVKFRQAKDLQSDELQLRARDDFKKASQYPEGSPQNKKWTKEGERKLQKAQDIRLGNKTKYRMEDEGDNLATEAKKYKTAEEFVKKLDQNTLDKNAFGIKNGDIKTFKPNELNIEYKDDFENAIYQQEKSGFSKDKWAKNVDLSDPIQVSLKNGKYIIEDGHHRYYASKILNKPIKAEVTIEDSAIKKLGGKDYDSYLTDIWNKANKTKYRLEDEGDDLISEAKKYKTADEFVKAQKISPELKDLERFAKNYKSVDGFKNELPSWNSAADISRMSRATNMDNLPRLEGDEFIEISRGVPDGVKKIRPGDWIMYDKKNTYSPNIITKKVPRSDLINQGTNPGEYIYAPKRLEITPEQFFTRIKTKSQLTDIWNKANKQSGKSAVDADDLATEAKKYKTADEFVKSQGTPVYHGSSKESIDSIEKGFKLLNPKEQANYQSTFAGEEVLGLSTSPSKAVAQEFQYLHGDGKIAELYISPTAKVKKLDDGQMVDDIPIEQIKKWQKEGYSVIAEMPQKGKRYDYETNKYIDDVSNEWNHLIIDESAVKTKSQLKDIWNKANNKTKFRVKDDFESIGIKLSDAQEKQIIALDKKLFGGGNIKITEQILTPQGQKALGAYRDGIIKIVKGKADAVDTYFHEAFHKYLDVLTTADEQADILVAAKKASGKETWEEVEEWLAETFIGYAQKRTGIRGELKAHFDNMLERVKTYFGNEDVIKRAYSEIMAGKKKGVKSVDEVQVTRKTAKTPQKPTEIIKKVENADKVSRIAKSIEQKMKDKGLIDEGSEIEKATFEGKTVKGQAEKTAKIIADEKRMNRIVNGEEELPADVTSSFFTKAVEDHALETGNRALAERLARSEVVSRTSYSAQDLRMAAERDPDSFTVKIREIVHARREALKSRLKEGKTVSDARRAGKKEIKQAIKKKASTPRTWANYIKEIECKV